MADQSAAMNGVFSAIRTLLVTIGTSLVAGGALTVHSQLYFWMMLVAGSIMVVGPAGWGVWSSIQHVRAISKATTIGVQAGINLTASGGALNTEGLPIEIAADGVPKSVTPESAKAIVQNFGPK
jgi:hypothetical protein